MEAYRTVRARGEEEIIIQKSRFIGRCFPVQSEEEALSILNDLRKQHWDATHNCYAYRIGPRGDCARYSDDGEPGGTAGMPMMEVLRSRDLTDVLVVVTRYFGGILLGAGGLVRAYSKSTAQAVLAAGEVDVIPALRYELRLPYNLYGTMEAYLRANSQVENAEFAEDVRVWAMVEKERGEGFCKAVVDLTNGRCQPAPAGEGSFLRPVEPR